MAKKPKDSIEINMDDVKEKVNELLATISSPKPLEYTLKDMYSRAPGKVVKAVTSVYNIKAREIKFKKYTEARRDFHYSREGFEKGGAGGIKAKGLTIASFKMKVEGERLTPVHFNMKYKPKNILEEPFKEVGPKDKKTGKKKKKRRETSVEFKVFKSGESAKLTENIFFTKTKNGVVLPWERKTSNRYDISPIRTTSIPMMVGPNEDTGKGGNPIVMEKINNDLEELLLVRLHHHLNRNLKKVNG